MLVLWCHPILKSICAPHNSSFCNPILNPFTTWLAKHLFTASSVLKKYLWETESENISRSSQGLIWNKQTKTLDELKVSATQWWQLTFCSFLPPSRINKLCRKHDVFTFTADIQHLWQHVCVLAVEINITNRVPVWVTSPVEGCPVMWPSKCLWPAVVVFQKD